MARGRVVTRCTSRTAISELGGLGDGGLRPYVRDGGSHPDWWYRSAQPVSSASCGG